MTGQLNLFKGKRQRGTLAPPPKEFAGHVVIADICKRWINPTFRYTHLPMGEHRDHAVNRFGKRYSPTGSRLQRMGVTTGWPDFLFVGPNLIFWLELKRQRRGRLSKEQIEMGAHLVACGHCYLCTSDVREAVATLVDLGILRRGVSVQ